MRLFLALALEVVQFLLSGIIFRHISAVERAEHWGWAEHVQKRPLRAPSHILLCPSLLFLLQQSSGRGVLSISPGEGEQQPGGDGFAACTGHIAVSPGAACSSSLLVTTCF